MPRFALPGSSANLHFLPDKLVHRVLKTEAAPKIVNEPAKNYASG